MLISPINTDSTLKNKKSYNNSFTGSIYKSISSDVSDIYRLVPFWKSDANDIQNQAEKEVEVAKNATKSLMQIVENDRKNGFSPEYKNGRLVKLYEMKNINGSNVPCCMYLFGERGTLDTVLDISDNSSPILTRNLHGSQYVYEFMNGEIKQITLGERKSTDSSVFSTRYSFQNEKLCECINSGITKYFISLDETGKEKRFEHTTSQSRYVYNNGEIELIEFGKEEVDSKLYKLQKSIRFNKNTIIYTEGFCEHPSRKNGKQGQTVVIHDNGNKQYKVLEYDEGWNYQYGTLLRGKSFSFDNQGKLVRFNTGYARDLEEYQKSKDWEIGPKEYNKQTRTIQGHNIVALNGIPNTIIEKFTL